MNEYAAKSGSYGIYMAIPIYPEEYTSAEIAAVSGRRGTDVWKAICSFGISTPVCESDDSRYCFPDLATKMAFLRSLREEIEGETHG